MPENMPTATGFQRRILEAAPDMNKRYAQRLANRVMNRTNYYTRFVGMPVEAVYEEGLRILGIHADPTARDAVRNVEAVAA